MSSGIKRGDIRLYQFAAPEKKAPVVVLTRDSAAPYLSTVTAPITTAIPGVPSEVLVTADDGMKTHFAINLHNLVTVAENRLGKRIGQLGALRIAEVCAALRFSLGCDGSEQKIVTARREYA